MFTASIANIVHWGGYHAWRRRWTLEPLRAVISGHLGREVADDEQIPLSVWADAPHEEGPQMEDYCIRWILECIPGGPAAIVSFAADCAEMVLPLWRHNTLPAECIAAVRAWVADPTPDRLLAVKRAREAVRDTYGWSTDPSTLARRAAGQAAVQTVDTSAGYRSSGMCRAAIVACEAFSYRMRGQPYMFASAEVEMQARQRMRLLQYLQDGPLPPLPPLPTRDEVSARAIAWQAADAARAAAREARAAGAGWGMAV